jgi:hypothetical protein
MPKLAIAVTTRTSAATTRPRLAQRTCAAVESVDGSREVHCVDQDASGPG